jgi:hypothetical protein
MLKAFSRSVALSFETPRKSAAPQDEVSQTTLGAFEEQVSDPHGEERGNAVRLEPRGHRMVDAIRPQSNPEVTSIEHHHAANGFAAA